jgi:hypothetical protein
MRISHLKHYMHRMQAFGIKSTKALEALEAKTCSGQKAAWRCLARAGGVAPLAQHSTQCGFPIECTLLGSTVGGGLRARMVKSSALLCCVESNNQVRVSR